MDKIQSGSWFHIRFPPHLRFTGVKGLCFFFPDLVPKENLEKWLNYLKKEFPTVAFKSATLMKDRTMVRALQAVSWLSHMCLQSYVLKHLEKQKLLFFKIPFPLFDYTAVTDGYAFALWLSFVVHWGNSCFWNTYCFLCPWCWTRVKASLFFFYCKKDGEGRKMRHFSSST